MSSRRLAVRRALVGCASAVIVLLLSGAGCSTTAAGPTVTGSRLTIYLSDPSTLASDQGAQDVVDAEKLAFSALSGQVSAFKLSLRTVRAARISSGARQAIEDSSAIAYLGEVLPGSSADSIGITNAQDLLQVSPTDNAVALTQKVASVPGSPGRFYESLSTYGHTFARLAPTSSHEAVALLSAMAALAVRSLHVVSDGSDYARAFASVIDANLRGANITLSASNAGAEDAVLYLGTSRAAATAALDAALSANPRVKLFVTSALADPSFVAGLSPAARRALYVTTPAPAASGAGTPAASFASAFASSYGHAPAPQAIFGYAAMQAVIRALAQAGSHAGDRSTVVHDLMGLRLGSSVLGPVAIDHQGDTNLGSFVLERVRAGRLVAVKPLQG